MKKRKQRFIPLEVLLQDECLVSVVLYADIFYL